MAHLAPKRRWSGMAALVMTLLFFVLQPGASKAQENYLIRSGDVLRIEVIEDTTLNRSVLVSPDGRITLPLAGAISVGGRSVESVQALITAQLAPNFAAPPNVFVAIERVAAPAAQPIPGPLAPPATDAIYVLGEVSNPGRIEVRPGTTVLQLFARIGGFTRFAATKRIQLRRTGADGVETIYTIDYDAILEGRSPNGTATVADGDVFVVLERRLFE